MVRKRNNVVMVRLPTPKGVTVPNGRLLLVECKHRRESELSANAATRRKYKKGVNEQGR